MCYLNFIYNIAIIIFFTLNVVLYYVYYKDRGEKVYLMISALFILYFLDDLILYMKDFIPNFLIFYNHYFIITPIISTFINLAFLWCYNLIYITNIGKAFGRRAYSGYLIFSFCTIVLSFTNFEFRNIIIDSMMSIAIVHTFIKALLLNHEKRVIEFSNLFIAIGLVLEILVSLEKSFTNKFPEIFSGRLDFVELVGCYFAFIALYYIFNSIFSDEKQDFDYDIFSNKYNLTDRELEVLKLIVKGKKNSEIADDMFISLGTVKVHVHNIYTKVGINNRVSLLNLVNE